MDFIQHRIQELINAVLSSPKNHTKEILNVLLFMLLRLELSYDNMISQAKFNIQII